MDKEKKERKDQDPAGEVRDQKNDDGSTHESDGQPKPTAAETSTPDFNG